MLADESVALGSSTGCVSSLTGWPMDEYPGRLGEGKLWYP